MNASHPKAQPRRNAPDPSRKSENPVHGPMSAFLNAFESLAAASGLRVQSSLVATSGHGSTLRHRAVIVLAERRPKDGPADPAACLADLARRFFTSPIAGE